MKIDCRCPLNADQTLIYKIYNILPMCKQKLKGQSLNPVSKLVVKIDLEDRKVSQNQ